LKQLRDQGSSWSEIAKNFPNRTEGSVKKHWYKARSSLLSSYDPSCSGFDKAYSFSYPLEAVARFSTRVG
jgi:hypothetical protein